MQTEPVKQLDSYELTARPMAMDDIPALHVLSIGVQWPHRPEDWAMLIRVGHGVVAEDAIRGARAGSATPWPMGLDFARIGMVITTPRLQEQGAGRWLMQQIAGPIGARDKALTATREALRLYLSLGFRPWGDRLPAPGDGGSDARRRTGRPADGGGGRGGGPGARRGGADRREPGGARRAAGGLGRHRAGEGRGGRGLLPALCRRFGRGHVVGPVVAASEADALALIAPHVAARAGRYPRLDTREAEGPLRAYLAECGLSLFETGTSMSLGRDRAPEGPARIDGLASHSLG